jgi:predicted transcriptional regulator
MGILKETAKDRILRIVHGQPADSTFDEILRELALARMIERGLEDSEKNRTISHKEMGQRISSWAR